MAESNSTPLLKLTVEQKLQISSYLEAEEYAAAYNAIASWLPTGGSSEVAATRYWFSQAGQINGGASSPSNPFIRAYTEKGLQLDGRPSDIIAVSRKD